MKNCKNYWRSAARGLRRQLEDRSTALAAIEGAGKISPEIGCAEKVPSSINCQTTWATSIRPSCESVQDSKIACTIDLKDGSTSLSAEKWAGEISACDSGPVKVSSHVLNQTMIGKCTVAANKRMENLIACAALLEDDSTTVGVLSAREISAIQRRSRSSTRETSNQAAVRYRSVCTTEGMQGF